GVAATTSIAELGRLAPEVSANYKVSLDNVAQDSSEHWRNLSANVFSAVERQYLDHVNKVRDGTLASSAALKDAAEQWSALARSSQTVLKEPVEAAVAEARKNLSAELRALDGNVERRIREFSVELKNLQMSTEDLFNKTRAIDRELANWASKAGPLTRDIVTATESIRRQSETHDSIVKRLDTAAEK